ncbi:sigma-54-dependent Fis family transcriptional regulator [Streptomyces sp. ME19-01-6]|uniref:sigma-54-dependent Fis family transcriptional regulator n=1 Tax=Streptomyces sp. ME19-01-6 TaxID=3028686 RepID=UPI0029B407A6|nr:helix-turn-helix domain-containing protein [Streptomyces sp. ME19-01-6]MDX3228334.1 helix-turn-helix domain-containing protein [Streptomyces sp. ME19-01-6]
MSPTDTAPRDADLRPEIALSWRRCRMSGLGPAAPDLRVEPDAVDRRSRLVAAAQPVLAELAGQLGDAAFCVMLADRESRIVDMPDGARRLRDRLAALGVVTGGVFMEETTGTNSIATVYELRRGLAVHGDEHYLEAFKQFSCYGHPIRHPVTRRLEGVLDITCLSADDSPLLGPFLARAAHDIEERLLQTARRAEQRMLAAFQMTAAGRSRPVLVLGEGVVLANPAAVELLDPVDHIRLRELAGGLSGSGLGRLHEPHAAQSIELSSGQSVHVRFRAVNPGADGVLFEFTAQGEACPAHGRGTPRIRIPRPATTAGLLPGAPVYIGGAPGTGRTTTARSLAGGHDRKATRIGAGPDRIGDTRDRIRAFDASEAAALGETAWLASFEAAVGEAPELLLVEDVHLLSDACAARLRRLMERAPGRIALTGAPLTELTGYAAALAADCPTQIALPALRDRAEDLPALVRAMLDDLGAGDRVRFTPTTLGALAGHPWPGNLRELHTVVRTVLAHRSAGDVTLRDLPAGYQVSPRLRRMTPLERAEHDAIATALREYDGNKLRAAQRLGISRTTLYSRMRALRITV